MRITLILFLAALAPALPAAAETAIGETVPAFSFKDIRYLERTLGDFGPRKAYVIMAASTTCPVAKRYLPRLDALAENYGDDVAFLVLNTSPDDTIMDMAQQGIDFDVSAHLAKDVTGEAVRALGLTRTPEVAVLDADRVLRYRGRVDSQYRVGGVNPEAGREDLKLALDAVIAGEDVEVAETPVDGCVITTDTETVEESPYTYAKDVAPILNTNCVKCHRDDGGAPFSLQTYSRASAMADMIAEVVSEGRMPPWYAHPEHGEFVNEPAMTPADRKVVVQWAKGGKPEGDPAALPEAPAFSDSEWRIGDPDLVVTAEDPMEIPATGYIPYQYIPLPYVFPHDTWVQGIEIKPANRPVLHHCNMIYMLPGQEYSQATQFLTGYVPGGLPVSLDNNRAMMIPKGATLVMQAHYVTTGKAETDRISVGIQYAKETVQKRVYYKIINDDSFAIPAGEPFHCVTAEDTMEADSTGIAMFSHMHLRGRDMTFLAHYPGGETETVLSIPNYNFDWQLSYVWEPHTKKFPKGTRIEVIAHYDNSPFNPYNPDPTDVVRDGPQTYEEMMYGFFFYTHDNERLNLTVNPNTGEAVTDAVAKIEPEN